MLLAVAGGLLLADSLFWLQQGRIVGPIDATNPQSRLVSEIGR
jgi:hypothetical protein